MALPHTIIANLTDRVVIIVMSVTEKTGSGLNWNPPMSRFLGSRQEAWTELF